jgi:hypothetical protein
MIQYQVRCRDRWKASGDGNHNKTANIELGTLNFVALELSQSCMATVCPRPTEESGFLKKEGTGNLIGGASFQEALPKHFISLLRPSRRPAFTFHHIPVHRRPSEKKKVQAAQKWRPLRFDKSIES